MRVVRGICLGAMAFLVACNNGSVRSEQLYDEAVAPVMPQPVMVEGDMDRNAKMSGDSIAAPSASNFLAYRYNYVFSLPSQTVESTAERHTRLCLEAGPTLCQVLSKSVRELQPETVMASLRLRAEPDWLEGFTGTMMDQVEEANGRMTSSGVSAEDLTRQILDVDARLSAQTTLRDRLTGLLETRDAELSDLLALERELARVQGDIESATSTLNVLRQRVSMSVVTIEYLSQQRAVSSSAVAPVGAALKDFVATVSQGLASVITFLALILPWLIFVVLPGLLGLMWFWRRRKSAKA